jgi:predicted regulator of Ras-like GTPase activity (Roadblock/LC7/MglB family)
MNDRIIGEMGVGPLLDELAGALPGTEGVVVLSADGLELAMSSGTLPHRASHLSAIAAGLHAIADAANRNNGGRRVDQTVVEMDYRMLVIVPLAVGALLAVVFDAVTDLSGAREKIGWFADRLSVRMADAELVPTP